MVPSPLTQKQLAVMFDRCNAATSGPWISIVEDRDQCSGSSFIQTAGEDIYLTGAAVEDQDFIASARQDVPILIAELRRLQGWPE